MTSINNSSRAASSARLACVQSLYKIEITGNSDDSIMFDYLLERWSTINGEGKKLFQPNKDKFEFLMCGVKMEKEEIDEIISAAISKDREFERLEILLKSILRAGTLELLREHNVPLAVIIDEYVEIAHAFYFEKEPAFVNGVLDTIGKTLRAS